MEEFTVCCALRKLKSRLAKVIDRRYSSQHHTLPGTVGTFYQIPNKNFLAMPSARMDTTWTDVGGMHAFLYSEMPSFAFTLSISSESSPQRK